jgi:plasmid stabilization system protein ParE
MPDAPQEESVRGEAASLGGQPGSFGDQAAQAHRQPASSNEEPQFTLRISDEFISDISPISSERVLAELRRVLELLQSFPEMGSSNVRESLKMRFGEGIRKIVVSRFVVIYRIGGNAVDILACVYGPRVL